MLTNQLHMIQYKGANEACELFSHQTLIIPLRSHCWNQYDEKAKQ